MVGDATRTQRVGAVPERAQLAFSYHPSLEELPIVKR